MNKARWFFLFLMLLQHACLAQVVLDKTSYNFGIIDKSTNRIADFKLTNNSEKHLYLMRAEADDDIRLYYLRSKIEKDSSAFIRLQYNPENIGPFKKTVRLFVSARPEPIELTIKGTVNYVDPHNDPDCPDFSVKKPVVIDGISVVVQVKDKATGEYIKKASVALLNPVNAHYLETTNREGKAVFNSTDGQHQIYIAAEGYEPLKMKEAVSGNNSFLIYQLEKSLVKQPEKEEITNEQLEVFVKEELVKEPVAAVLADSPGELEQKETADEVIAYVPNSKDELPVDEYAPCNIVFLMDISSSMANYDKMPLLKTSVKEMLKMLRSFDRVGIITYASSTNILLPSASGTEKTLIASLVDSLLAGGLTAGGRGIKEAYEMAWENFIEDGNNQVILVTDGVFNISDEGYNLLQDVRRNANRGVTISVIGIKNGKVTFESLKEIAKKGKGNYTRIRTEEEAKAGLVNEVKLSSKIKK